MNRFSGNRIQGPTAAACLSLAMLAHAGGAQALHLVTEDALVPVEVRLTAAAPIRSCCTCPVRNPALVSFDQAVILAVPQVGATGLADYLKGHIRAQ